MAVIGFGPSGIFASASISEVADVTVFERASVMGGQWNFMEEELVEPDRQHSRYLFRGSVTMENNHFSVCIPVSG